MLELDLNIVAVDANPIGGEVFVGRRPGDFAGEDTERRHVQGAHDLIARDVTFAQRCFSVRAGIIDGVERAAEVDEADASALNLHALC